MTKKFFLLFMLSIVTACGDDFSPGEGVSTATLAGIAFGDSICGNGVAGPGKCDDGNTNDGDGCSAVCQLEPPSGGAKGWSCPLSGAGPCSEICGDGVLQQGGAIVREQCDDGNLIPGDGCSPNCRFPACGDGYVDSGEACDDGSFNGLPGQCNVTCSVALEWSVSAQTANLTLPTSFTMVAVFASDFYGTSEGDFDADDYLQKVNFLGDKDMVAGRVGQLTQPAVGLKNILLIYDDGIDPFDGGGLSEAALGMIELLPGTFSLPAGTWVMSPVAGGSFSGGCPCGRSGSVQALDCVDNGLGGLPPLGDPFPGCFGSNVECPDFKPANAVSMNGGLLNPPTGGQMSCDRQCWVAGGLASSCTEDDVRGPSLDIGLGVPVENCSPVDAPEVDRICQQISGVAACPGGCEGNPSGVCGGMTYDGELPDKSCLIARGASGCYQTNNTAAFGTLPMLDAWFRCVGSGSLASECTQFMLPSAPGALLGEDEKAAIFCSSQENGTQRCSVCSEKSTGGACVPMVHTGDEPLFRHIPVRDENPWASPQMEDEGRLAALAQLTLPRVDPRLAADAKESDPVLAATGELALSAEDVSYPSRGVPFSFERFYRSGGVRGGSLGPGWTHSYEERIEIVGDDYNRDNTPRYCLVRLPAAPNCLYHIGKSGGEQLYVRVPKQPYFVSTAGDFSIISATDDVRLLRTARNASPVFDGQELPAAVWLMRSPGGLMRTFSIPGVLLAITDEMGFGVSLDWRRRPGEEVRESGTWLDARPRTPAQFASGVRPDGAGIAAAFSKVSRPSSLILERAVDSYGRVFEFSYGTWKVPGSTANAQMPAASGRRLRLHQIFRADNPLPLVTYEHNGHEPDTNLDLNAVVLSDAYLTAVVRTGERTPGTPFEPGSATRTEYEYPHTLFADGGALHANDGPAVTWDSPLGESFAQVFDELATASEECAGGVSAGRPGFPPAGEGRCTLSYIPETLPTVGAGQRRQFALDEVFRTIADNIIRVRSGGEIELESLYSIDPTSPDFDRVVEQRFGAVSEPAVPPENVTLSLFEGVPPVAYFQFMTTMPSVRLREVSGVASYSASGQPLFGLPLTSVRHVNNSRRVFVEDQAVVPPALLAALGQESLIPEFTGPIGFPGFDECDPLLAAFEALPNLTARLPAGRRSDQNLAATPDLAYTTEYCAAIAARHSRGAFNNGRIDPETVALAALPGGDRQASIEWDLALACRFVQTVDREGVTRTDALNFRGDVIASEGPSPSGTGRVITKRRYNVDGMLVEEVRPDGSRTTLTYDGATPLFQYDLVLRRGNITSVTEHAGTTGELAKRHLSLFAPGTITSQTWQFTYEPIFQKLSTATGPDGVTATTRYDYEQAGFARSGARFTYETQTGMAVPSQAQAFDFDGDGNTGFILIDSPSAVEFSAQPVLMYTEGVNVGGGSVVQGRRYRRDASGRLIAESSIAELAHGSDFDVVEYLYYDNIADGEAGATYGDCPTCVRGPLAEVRRKQTPSSTAPAELERETVTYDVLGAVSSTVKNLDSATLVSTKRNSMGQILSTEAFGQTDDYVHDDRGNTTLHVRSSADTEPLVTVSVWGNQQVARGTCVEVKEAGCSQFETFVKDFEAFVAGNGTNPGGLEYGRFLVPIRDAEDRTIGSYDSAGLTSSVVLNDAGLPASTTVDGSPSTTVTFQYDNMGRMLRETVGTTGSPLLESVMQYDRLGRPVAQMTRATVGAAFSDTTGTVERVGYDGANRVVVGVTAAGGKVLAAERVERNEVGAPLFVHRLSMASQPTQPSPLTAPSKTGSGAVAGDQWDTTTYAYDAAGRDTFVEREGADFEYRTYDGFGLAYEQSTANHVTTWARSPLDRTVTRTVERASDTLTTTTLHTEIETYTPRGQLQSLEVFDAAGTVDRTDVWTYDSVGRPVAHEDPEHRWTQTVYDRVGQPVEMREYGPNATTPTRTRFNEFDVAGRLTEESIGSAAPPTLFTYDVRGRLLTETSAQTTTTLTRDAAGRLTSHERVVGSNARKTHFQYGANRAAPESIKSGPVFSSATLLRSFVRDGVDRATSALDTNYVDAIDSSSTTFRNTRPQLTTVRSFDTLGRARTDQLFGIFPSGSVVFSGQSNVEIARVNLTYPETAVLPSLVTTKRGEELTFSTNGLGLMASVARRNTIAGGALSSVSFDYVGHDWVRATTATGRFVTKGRDALGQVTQSALSSNTTTVRFLEDVLRTASGKIAATRTTSTLKTAPDLRGYSYDALARLGGTKFDANTALTQSAFKALAPAVLANEAHPVVAAPDNVTATTLTLADNITNATADEAGRQYTASYSATSTGVPPTSVVGSSIVRDVRDRMSTDGASNLKYTYDAQDRLVLVERLNATSGVAGEEMRMGFDGLGRRRMERIRTGTGATGQATSDRVLEYLGANVIESSITTTINPIAAATGVVETTTHAPGIDAPLLVTNGPSSTSTQYVLGTNARGDVVSVITNSGGAVVEEQVLDPWGERTLRRPSVADCVDGKENGSLSMSRPLSACGPVATVVGRFGIGGARQHARTKLVDLRNRVYATHLRMFLTQDPLGNVDAEGLYAYVAADPINFRDPWGREKTPDADAEKKKKEAEEKKRKEEEEKRAAEEARQKLENELAAACDGGDHAACDQLFGVATAGFTRGPIAVSVERRCSGDACDVYRQPLEMWRQELIEAIEDDAANREEDEAKEKKKKAVAFARLIVAIVAQLNGLEESTAATPPPPLPKKVPVRGSGKARATDVPTWAQGQVPNKGETGAQFAKRLMEAKYGADFKYPTGPNSEFNKIKKYGDRGFEDPK